MHLTWQFFNWTLSRLSLLRRKSQRQKTYWRRWRCWRLRSSGTLWWCPTWRAPAGRCATNTSWGWRRSAPTTVLPGPYSTVWTGSTCTGKTKGLTKCVHCLVFRISLNMLTRQHLMVYGHDTMVSSDHLKNSLTTSSHQGLLLSVFKIFKRIFFVWRQVNVTKY